MGQLLGLTRARAYRSYGEDPKAPVGQEEPGPGLLVHRLYLLAFHRHAEHPPVT